MKSASILQLSILPGQANYRTHSANVLLTIHFTEMQTDGLRIVSAGSEFFSLYLKLPCLLFMIFHIASSQEQDLHGQVSTSPITSSLL